MIKGVNRQVVDVAETGSEYFERALFFVKPEFSGLSEGKLKEKAQQIVKSASAPPKSKVKKSKLQVFVSFIKYCAAFAGGAAVTVILSALSTL